MHPRVMLLQNASCEFAVFWAKLQRKNNIKTYEHGFLILNRIEKFWIEASMEGWSTHQACEKWLEKVTAEEVSEREAGDELAYLVRDCGLTYGEVFSIFSEVRATSVKYYIRAERHPDDPDKPGGLA